MAKYESEGTWFGEQAKRVAALAETAKALETAPSWDDVKVSFGGQTIPVVEVKWADGPRRLRFLAGPERLPQIVPPLIRFDGINITGWDIEIRFWVNDRSNPSSVLLLYYNEPLPFTWDSMPREERVAWIRQRMICVATHEIDEALFMSGLAPDPHDLPINCREVETR